LSHPMVTMRYLDTHDGKVQVKWWGDCRILAMYNVELSMSSSEEGCLHDEACVEALTSLCKRLLSLDRYNIREIRLGGDVEDPDLLDIEHTILLKHLFLKSIVEVESRYIQIMKDEVRKEILHLEEKKGRRSSMDSLLTRCGWVHSDSNYRLRRFAAML